MRFSLLLVSVTVFAATQLAIAEEWEPEVAHIALPPDSIAEWYMPQNERQVWLHLMFDLRTELGAVELYLERKQQKKLVEWAVALEESYAKITEMVPEWAGEVELGATQALRDAAAAGDLENVEESVTQLRRTCSDCHSKWSASTVALYRSPDYSQLRLQDSKNGNEVDYAEAMREMSRSLVELKVARADGNFEEARKATIDLEARLRDLGESCDECHRDPSNRERFLGADALEPLKALRTSLTEPHDPKLSGRHLGTFGSTVCGGCHGVHRSLSELRSQLKP
ncbi:MAG: cytochrome c [Deltaproteobacteria bacterium]|nr:cytochrome c [Deltaproteobacteria bacterium]MBW2396728.1 cytochrome c [Deltaproteobacteria bacterium]